MLKHPEPLVGYATDNCSEVPVDSSYRDGGEKDSVQGNKQTTVATPWTVQESGP